MRIKLACGLGMALCSTIFAADLPPPNLNVTVSNNVKTVTWGPLEPALEVLRLVSGVDLLTMSNNTTAVLFKSAEGYGFRLTNSVPRQFYSVEATQLSSNALLSYNVLNRLAYGPTPDDIERVLTGPSPTGPQAFIQEQLVPENIVNTWDDYTSVTTNAVNLPPNTNWTTVSVTGQVSSSSIYMYPVS